MTIGLFTPSSTSMIKEVDRSCAIKASSTAFVLSIPNLWFTGQHSKVNRSSCLAFELCLSLARDILEESLFRGLKVRSKFVLPHQCNQNQLTTRVHVDDEYISTQCCFSMLYKYRKHCSHKSKNQLKYIAVQRIIANYNLELSSTNRHSNIASNFFKKPKSIRSLKSKRYRKNKLPGDVSFKEPTDCSLISGDTSLMQSIRIARESWPWEGNREKHFDWVTSTPNHQKRTSKRRSKDKSISLDDSWPWEKHEDIGSSKTPRSLHFRRQSSVACEHMDSPLVVSTIDHVAERTSSSSEPQERMSDYFEMQFETIATEESRVSHCVEHSRQQSVQFDPLPFDEFARQIKQVEQHSVSVDKSTEVNFSSCEVGTQIDETHDETDSGALQTSGKSSSKVHSKNFKSRFKRIRTKISDGFKSLSPSSSSSSKNSSSVSDENVADKSSFVRTSYLSLMPSTEDILEVCNVEKSRSKKKRNRHNSFLLQQCSKECNCRLMRRKSTSNILETSHIHCSKNNSSNVDNYFSEKTLNASASSSSPNSSTRFTNITSDFLINSIVKDKYEEDDVSGKDEADCELTPNSSSIFREDLISPRNVSDSRNSSRSFWNSATLPFMEDTSNTFYHSNFQGPSETSSISVNTFPSSTHFSERFGHEFSSYITESVDKIENAINLTQGRIDDLGLDIQQCSESISNMISSISELKQNENENNADSPISSEQSLVELQNLEQNEKENKPPAINYNEHLEHNSSDVSSKNGHTHTLHYESLSSLGSDNQNGLFSSKISPNCSISSSNSGEYSISQKQTLKRIQIDQVIEPSLRSPLKKEQRIFSPPLASMESLTSSISSQQSTDQLILPKRHCAEVKTAYELDNTPSNVKSIRDILANDFHLDSASLSMAEEDIDAYGEMNSPYFDLKMSNTLQKLNRSVSDLEVYEEDFMDVVHKKHSSGDAAISKAGGKSVEFSSVVDLADNGDCLQHSPADRRSCVVT